MKKLVSLLLCLLMCTSLLGPAALAKEVEIVYDGTPFAPITSEPVTLTVLSSASGSKQSDYETMKWFHLALENTNVTLEVELVDFSSYDEVMSTRLAAGIDLPDIIWVSTKDPDGTYSNAGLFKPLNEYDAKYGINSKKIFERYNTLRGSCTSADGTQYYMPYYQLATEHAVNFSYNVKLFEDYQIPVPTTTDELYETLKALKAVGDWNGNGKADEVPLYFRRPDGAEFKQMASFWGLDLVSGYKANEEGIVKCGFVQPEYKEYLLFCRKLIEEGLLNEDYSTGSWDQCFARWTNNSVGMQFDWTSNISELELAMCPDYNFRTDDPVIAVLPPLTGPYGDDCYMGRDPAGKVFAITSSCEYPEVAYCVMDYLLNDEVVDMTWLGVEGVDYTKDAEGTLTFTDEYYTNKDNYRDRNGYNAEMLPGGQSLYGYGLAANNAKSVAQWLKNAEKTVLPLGFTYLEEEYNDIMSTYQVDLNTYIDESLAAFVLGIRDIESEWDSYVEDCYNLGLEQMEKVYQARYDKTK